jgi:hypothetical protein
MVSYPLLTGLIVCRCPFSPFILGIIGLGLGFIQDSLFIASDEQGFKWIPATAVGLALGWVITLGFNLVINLPPIQIAGESLGFFTFAWIGWVCSLFQIRALGKKQAFSYLVVSWAGCIIGAYLGGLINERIQLLGAGIDPAAWNNYIFLGYWAHILIVVMIYGIVTSGILYLYSGRTRSYDRRILLKS